MHHHHEHCGCGCGHDHEHEHHHEHHGEHGGELTPAQAAFLHELEHHHYLPLARFLVESTAEDDFSSVALSPVYLRSPEETMEAGVKTVLTGLADCLPDECYTERYMD